MSCVINPKTGRAVRIGTATYKKLVKAGLVEGNPMVMASNRKTPKPKKSVRKTPLTFKKRRTPNPSPMFGSPTQSPMFSSLNGSPSRTVTETPSSTRTLTDSPASKRKSRIVGNLSSAKPRMLFGMPGSSAMKYRGSLNKAMGMNNQTPRRSARTSVKRVLFNPRTGK